MEGDRIDLSDFGLSSLFNLQTEVDSLLCMVLKVSTVKETRGIQARMTTIISKAWKSAAASAINSGVSKLLKGSFTNTRINSFLRGLGIKLSKPLTTKQRALLRTQLDRIWKISKRIGAKEAKVKVSFSAVDRKAVAAINRHQVFWIGDFYNDKLSQRITAVSRDVLLEQGLSHREAGKELRSALRQEFGIVPGGKSKYASDVLARYAGNPDLYFEQVASTAAHQGRTFGKLQSFTEADVTVFRLTNPQDERTGSICSQMHGQTFAVQTGVDQMNKLLSAKDPTDVKNTAPWLSGPQIEERLDGARRGSRDASERLAEAGVILPPFHSKCRTEMVIVR